MVLIWFGCVNFFDVTIDSGRFGVVVVVVVVLGLKEENLWLPSSVAWEERAGVRLFGQLRATITFRSAPRVLPALAPRADNPPPPLGGDRQGACRPVQIRTLDECWHALLRALITRRGAHRPEKEHLSLI